MEAKNIFLKLNKLQRFVLTNWTTIDKNRNQNKIVMQLDLSKKNTIISFHIVPKNQNKHLCFTIFDNTKDIKFSAKDVLNVCNENALYIADLLNNESESFKIITLK